MKSTLWSTLLLACLALPLMAQSGSGLRPRPERIARALNLSEAQKTSIKTIRDKHHPTMVLQRDAVKQAGTALRTALQDGSISDTQLRILYDKAASTRFELMLARRSMQREVQAVLTPEQRIKAAELRGMAKARMRMRLQGIRLNAGLAG
jgi:Spy/CpxP family protein refolding chaperone